MSSLPPTGCLAGIKHPGKRHLAPRANFHHNASSLFFCKLLVQKSEEISLVLFFFFFSFERRAWEGSSLENFPEDFRVYEPSSPGEPRQTIYKPLPDLSKSKETEPYLSQPEVD